MKKGKIFLIMIVSFVFLIFTGCGDNTPQFSVNDDQVIVCVGEVYQINYIKKNIDEDIIWTSGDDSVATVDNNGLITGIKDGITSIYVSLGEKEKEIVVVVNEKQVTLNYDGGSSKELYSANLAVAQFVLSNYNDNSGAYWNGSGYSKYIYITDKKNDPTATFSDRIYIGKNKYTGYYEIIDILTVGGSSWPEGAEYVITMSTHYSDYSSVHSSVLKLKVGQIVIIDGEISKISGTNTSRVKFYNKEIQNDDISLNVKDLSELPVPVKLGCEFLGWYDEDDNKVESLDSLKSSTTLKAKWFEYQQVSDFVFDKVPEDLLTGETFELNGKVYPDDAYFKEVIYSSSNEDILTIDKNGKIEALNSGKAIVTVVDYTGKIKKNLEITVNSISSVDVEFVGEDEYHGYLEVGKTVTLKAQYFGKGSVNSIKFTSNNPSIATIDENGKVKAINEGTAIITIDADTTNGSYQLLVNVLVKNVSINDKIDEVIKLIMDNNFSVVETGNLCLYGDSTSRYYSATYGSVNRILFVPFEINDQYKSVAEANGNCHKSRRSVDTIEFVTVHDTATLTGSAAGTAKGMASGTTSIHYVVGNDEIYSVVPEKYIAYHAGDGTGYSFEWYASGIKATDDSAPEIGIVKDGTKYYFTINGEKSNLSAPITNGSKTIANPSNDSLTELGPVWKIENGEYYLGPTWACFDQVSSGKICSRGGNCNSIGIEMCVNVNSDMYDTWQRTAMLVADICIRNNLDLTRVKQHNTWTAKNCPQDIIAGSYWEEFMKMVEVQYKLQKDYSDVVITMKSNNPDLVDDTGRVINAPSITTEVSYDVTVTCGDISKTITLYSVIPGSTVWEQWNGSYSISKIWNNGNFAR